MDAKTRTIGIDKDFLDQQIQEKELQRKQEEDDIVNYGECISFVVQVHSIQCSRISTHDKLFF
jgi:hypothetical protein